MLGEAMPHSNYSSAPSSPTASSTSSSEITPVGTITTDRIPAYKAVSCSTPRTPRTAPANFLSSPQRSPIALSPDITIRGYPRDEGRRSRASSCVTSVHPHRHKSPPRSPYDTKLLYEHALQKAVTDTATVTDDIISRQSEILARKHDIAIWQRKIHAAEKLINGLQEQVDVLVAEAREKQDAEKELACQRDAMMANGTISQKEWTALTAVLANADIKNKRTSV